MELLLNLAWLLLALPAYILWRRSRTAGQKRSISSLQCLLALGCVLVMLFPVVSATDDLRAMRAEMEESPASKRNVRQAGTEKASTWNSRLQSPPALLAAGARLFPFLERSEQIFPSPSFPLATTLAGPTGRAPPVSRLA